MQKDPDFSNQSQLRQKAEEQLKIVHSQINGLTSETDILKVFHELKVYQIELEMQNEELKRAKEKAELAEKKYTDLYESAPSGYLTLSRQGDILELNESAAQLLHKERAMLIGNRLALFVSENTRVSFNEFMKKLFASTTKESCEAILEKDGVLFAHVSIDGVVSKDRQTHLLSLVDITQCKQAEEKMRQLEVDREALKFKQNFLANMSHEIRTPLTGVLGMIEILEHTKLTAEQKDYINTLKLSGENLKMIINEVLDYSKIEAGKVKIIPSVFLFNSLFSQTEKQFKNRVEKGVKLKIQNDPDIPGYIYADKKRIHQILNNLVANAIKFTHQGSILLKSKLVSPNPSGNEIMIKISVTDTGIGIPARMISKLFIPFLQIDDKDTREYEGTGLGLSICKELAKLLGGKIGLESEHHKGSTFWFIFPAKVAESQQNETTITQKPEPVSVNHELSVVSNGSYGANNRSCVANHGHHSNGKLRILFADDKKVNQKVISLILKSMGHEVTLASNGEEAIHLYQPGEFDLILMDIQMPVMDGITATQKLKGEYKDLPPIVGLSASAFEGDREKYLALGMDDYLTKPINTGEFIQLTERIRN